jgi:hypothetical protein
MKNLAAAFPKDFTLLKFNSSLSAEGGDEDLIWMPDGKVAFLVGRNRARVFLERSRQEVFEDKKISSTLIEEARKAYSDALYGIDVIFMPEKVLANPALGSKETFHLDMITTTMPAPDGKGLRAFIPTYGKEVYDAISFQRFDNKFVKEVQNEYDQAAAQFKKMGYEVIRLVYNDHPVRGPVNIGRFRNKLTGKSTVLLGKYPYHLPVSDPETPQAKINQALDNLNAITSSWMEAPTADRYENVRVSVDTLWKTMDEVSQAHNPIYEAQAALFKSYGYEVMTIPMYAWGGGGLHCQMMY